MKCRLLTVREEWSCSDCVECDAHARTLSYGTELNAAVVELLLVANEAAALHLQARDSAGPALVQPPPALVLVVCVTRGGRRLQLDVRVVQPLVCDWLIAQ